MQDINQKIAVSVQPFKGKVSFDNQTTTKIPWWIYLIGGVLTSDYWSISLRIYPLTEKTR